MKKRGFWASVGDIIGGSLMEKSDRLERRAEQEREQQRESNRELARFIAEESNARQPALPDSVRDDVLQRAAEIVAERSKHERP